MLNSKQFAQETKAVYRTFRRASDTVKAASEKKRENMQVMFARFGIAAQLLDKGDYLRFVSCFYLKDRKLNIMSEKAMKVCASFGNKAAGLRTDEGIAGFESANLYEVDKETGLISEETFLKEIKEYWLPAFKEKDLKSWDDFRLYGIPDKEETILSEVFKEVEKNALDVIKPSVDHTETFEQFEKDLHAALVRCQDADDRRNEAAAKKRDKEKS